MFELADKLVGIYKTHDVTQTITINPNAMMASVKAEKQEPKDVVKPEAVKPENVKPEEPVNVGD